MTKHHAKHKKNHSNPEEEAGFLSFNFKRFMDRRDKYIIIAIALGVVALIVASLYIITNRGKEEEKTPELEIVTEEEKLVVTTPYPTVPKEITSTTIMVNERAILPNSITVKKGAEIGFFNETSTPITLQSYNNANTILNIEVPPFDVPTIVLNEVGTYKYINPLHPEAVAEIIVKE